MGKYYFEFGISGFLKFDSIRILMFIFRMKKSGKMRKVYLFYSKVQLDIILIIRQKIVEIHKTFLP